jgi:hypothetical protein
MNAMLSQAGLPPEVEAQMGPMFAAMTGGAGLAAILTVPLFFLIGSFIYHLLAKVMGGVGEYSTLAYLMATYQAPLTIASSVLSIIPALGGCLAFLLSIYSYVLSYYAIKANYGLSSGKAIAIVLIPIVVIFLLLTCFAVVIIGGIAALSGNN